MVIKASDMARIMKSWETKGREFSSDEKWFIENFGRITQDFERTKEMARIINEGDHTSFENIFRQCTFKGTFGGSKFEQLENILVAMAMHELIMDTLNARFNRIQRAWKDLSYVDLITLRPEEKIEPKKGKAR